MQGLDVRLHRILHWNEPHRRPRLCLRDCSAPRAHDEMLKHVMPNQEGAIPGWRKRPRKPEEALQRPERDVGKVRRADGVGLRHLEVARQLVEHNQGRLVTDQVDPIAGQRLRAVLPELRETSRLADLLGDVAPQELIRAVMSVEDGGSDRLEPAEGMERRSDALPDGGVFREQAEGDQRVRLATAHRL